MGQVFNFETFDTSSFSLKKEKVDLSEWTPGVESYVFVYELTAAQRDTLQYSIRNANLKFSRKLNRVVERTDRIGSSARIAAACCFDDEGKRIFEGQEKRLSEMPGGFLDKITDVYVKLNPSNDSVKFSDEDEENELEKN